MEETKALLRDDEGQQSPELVSYQYTALDAPTHIRVLEILPGNPDSDIHFRLRETNLGDGDIYYAVSYAWGSPIFSHKIYSAEGFIQVTKNLWEALRRYRDADEITALWVDAVCIDQANDEERSQQTVLMQRIYSESKHVLIWLGLELPTDRLAFEFITRVVDFAADKDFDVQEDLDALSNGIISMRNNENQDAVTELFAKSWFSRVWTFQEICCAAEATLKSGSLDMDFECLSGFCILLDFILQTGWLKSVAAQRGLGQIAGLHFTKDHLSQPSAINLLFELVKRNRNRKATDPRDMIYGLVALASDIKPLPFAPTYEIAVNHLYEEYAAHVIRQNQNLDISDNCFFQPGLPSWVPDWTNSEDFTIPINLEEDRYRAAGTSGWDSNTAIVNHSLGVEAICLDRLQIMTSPGPTPNVLGIKDWENDYQPITKWQQNIIRETMEITSLSHLYRSEQERWHAWWWTFIGGRKNQMERATPDYERRVRTYREVVDAFDNNLPLESVQDYSQIKFAQICRSVASMEHNRRFCLSREGRIGWVPLAARTGDIISLMRGSPVPVIIRPIQQENSYLMIGQAYIHGIMDGEAVAEKEDQFQRIQLV